MKTKILLFATLLFIYSCSENDDFGISKEINIYPVKEGEMYFKQTEVDIDTLELEEIPWLPHSEIDFYDWSSHMFYTNVTKKISSSTVNFFVVKAGNEPLFLCHYALAGSSFIYPFTQISPIYSGNIVRMGWFGMIHDETTQVNKDFKAALIKENLLNLGIELDIIELRRKDASTLLYTFKITNLDSENIYVLDPDVMGPKHFSYFTHGVTFIKDGEDYVANYPWESPEDGIPVNWFYKIQPRESMNRTVELTGFSNIPLGMVNSLFRFPGYTPKDVNWKTEDGRYWLGETWIEKSISID
jgi:hypothetical protein